MDEKKIIELSGEIVNAIVDLSLGKGSLLDKVGKGMVSKLVDHPKFEEIKQCYIDYLSEITDKVDSASELKRLTDFRYAIVRLYQNEEANEDAETEA